MSTDPIAAARALIAEADNPRVHGLLMTARDLRDMVATLADAAEAERAARQKAEAERDQALARLAAAHREAIERCAALLIELGYVSESGETLADEVRGLRVDPDAQAALDKMLAEARREGWRAGRDAAAEVAAASGVVKSAPLNDGCGTMICQPVLGSAVAAHIRALPEPKEASHE